ncbi:coiled-coil domain-containing protein 157-like [Hetaerina americana]|uniref:coiled-coil domain-containing protein 157-like n=1 Tax=Hetaerina americana TaxID=62018 RepID=UPI003A7F1316
MAKTAREQAMQENDRALARHVTALLNKLDELERRNVYLLNLIEKGMLDLYKTRRYEKSIYDHLSKMDDAKSQHTLMPNKVFEKSSQTLVISLNHCENCHTSKKIVRAMVSCIENMFRNIDEANESDAKNVCKESSVSKFKDEVQNRKRIQEEAQAVRAGVEHLEEELVAARRNADILIGESEGERIQFLFQIQELQGNLERTKTENVSLAMELQQSQEEQSRSLNEICKLKSRLLEQKEEVILLSKYPNFFEQMDSELIGIPEVDMENQIKANNIRIKLLRDENAALGHTISKLKIKGQETAAGRGMERN